MRILCTILFLKSELISKKKLNNVIQNVNISNHEVLYFDNGYKYDLFLSTKSKENCRDKHKKWHIA